MVCLKSCISFAGVFRGLFSLKNCIPIFSDNSRPKKCLNSFFPLFFPASFSLIVSCLFLSHSFQAGFHLVGVSRPFFGLRKYSGPKEYFSHNLFSRMDEALTLLHTVLTAEILYQDGRAIYALVPDVVKLLFHTRVWAGQREVSLTRTTDIQRYFSENVRFLISDFWGLNLRDNYRIFKLFLERLHSPLRKRLFSRTRINLGLPASLHLKIL